MFTVGNKLLLSLQLMLFITSGPYALTLKNEIFAETYFLKVQVFTINRTELGQVFP